MNRPYKELMEKAECKQYALAEKIYQLGRADQKKEDNEFFNFESAWELEKQKIRADTIDECINSLGMVLDNENIKSELKHLFEQLKENL